MTAERSRLGVPPDQQRAEFKKPEDTSFCLSLEEAQEAQEVVSFATTTGHRTSGFQASGPRKRRHRACDLEFN